MIKNEISVENLRGNLFIIGRAGTGKTRFIKEIIPQLFESYSKITVLEPFGEYSDIENGVENVAVVRTDDILEMEDRLAVLKDGELKALSESDVVIIDEASLIQNSNPSVLEYIIKKLNSTGIKVVAAFQSNRGLISSEKPVEVGSKFIKAFEIQKETVVGNIKVIETDVSDEV